MGVVGTLLPFLLYIWAVARVRAERAAIAATLEPVLAAALAWVWLGEELSALQVVGGGLVLGAVLMLQPNARKSPDPKPPRPTNEAVAPTATAETARSGVPRR